MTAFKGAGSALKVGDGASPESFTTIATVIDISGPDGQVDEIEVTNLSSTRKEHIPGLEDLGSVSFEAHLSTQNTQHQQLFSDKDAGTERTYRIEFGDPSASPAAYQEFTAYVSQVTQSISPNDSVKISGSLRVTSAITRSW